MKSIIEMSNGFVLFHTTVELSPLRWIYLSDKLHIQTQSLIFHLPSTLASLLLLYFLHFFYPDFQLKSLLWAPEICRSVSWPTVPSDWPGVRPQVMSQDTASWSLLWPPEETPSIIKRKRWEDVHSDSCVPTFQPGKDVLG